MAEVQQQGEGYTPAPAKDPKQLKKEKKEQERLQKEREKLEKKLEREKKKKEEAERKKREKEAKKKGKSAAEQNSGDQQPLANGEGGGDAETNSATSPGDTSVSEDKSAQPASPLSPAAETAASGSQRSVSSSSDSSGADKVTIAEPPGQISGCGTPIWILFDASKAAGEGAMTASCSGSNVGSISTSVTETARGMYRVQFTPQVADVYKLSVRWGGMEVSGSPFTLNLSVLPQQEAAAPPGETQAPSQAVQQKEGGDKVVANGEPKKEEEEEEEEEISDDPFDMARQASRLLEEQRKQATASFNSDSSTSTPPPQSGSSHLPHPPPGISPARPLPTTSGGASPVPYPSPNQPLPFPEGFPATKEDVSYLEEMNKKLQVTNEDLGQEVADLKKKMGEFEAKLTSIEETSKAAEEERMELMANISLRGWLYKRGIKGPTANVWRYRYFRCDQGNKIYYYKAADDPTPKGNIDLEKVESVEAVESDADPEYSHERFCFNIICPDRTFQLHTDSEDTRRQWITAIQYLKNWHQKNKSTLQSLALSRKD